MTSTTRIITGTPADDLITATGADDDIDGGAGIDTVVYSGSLSQYRLLNQGTSWLVDASTLGSGSDTLRNVEYLRFADGTLNLATGALVPAAAVITSAGSVTTASGTAGNDSFDLSKITTKTNLVDGGAGLDTVILPYARDWYRFTQNSNGNWVATEAHATGQQTTLSGIEQLKFAGTLNKVYDASGTLITATTPPSAPPAPTLTVQAASGNEDSAIALSITAVAPALTAAETVAVTISGVPSGARLSAGSLGSDGTWSLTAAQLQGLTLTPPTNTDADFTLTIRASVIDPATGASAPATAIESVFVAAVADLPTLTLQAAHGSENSAIALTLAAALSDSDGSESLAIVITGVPTGARLSAGSVNPDGSWSLTPAQLSGLTLTPPTNSDADFTLSVSASATEAANGASATVHGTLAVTVDATLPVFTTSGTTTTVIGTTASETIDLSRITTKYDVVDGGAGTDTVVLPFSQDWYRFAHNSDGNWLVTEAHATGQQTTLSGVEQLKFANNPGNLYDVSGTLISTVPPVTTPGPTTPTVPDTIIQEPAVLQAALASELVGLKLQNNGTTAEHGAIVTFGQVFAPGDLRPGTALSVNGQAVQIDIKALNPDGSVRDAILSLRAPDLAAGASADLMLVKGSATTPAAALQATDLLTHGYNLTLAVTIHNADGTSTLQTIDGATVVRQALASGTVETWLSGSLVSEFRVETKISGNLRAELDIRLDAAGKFTTDVIMANDGTFSAVGTVNYDIAIRQDGQTAFSDSGIAQYRNSTWHHEVSSVSQTPLHVVYDVDYLNHTGAIPTIDTTIGVSSAALATEVTALAASDTGPMGSALVTPYMPETGGRADLGPTTAWSAFYLASQDARAEAVMLANADASGSVPWHYRDEATGDPVRLDQHPGFWIDSRAGSAGPATSTTTLTQDTGWTPDTAHTPALTYQAYLVTGEHYYLDEMQAEVSWQLAAHAPGYRDQVGTDQVRDLAWSLRDLGNVAYITPDADPLKSYFTTALTTKLDQLVKYYVTDHAMQASGALEGWVKGSYGDNTGTVIAPWQEDYLATVLGDLNSQGFTQAGVLLNWMDNFISGRFLNAANGYDPLHGPAYNLTLVDPVTKVPYATWSQVSQASFGANAAAPTQLDGYPDAATGSAATAKAALASIISATGSVDAIEAYGYLASLTGAMSADYANYPTWAITPKLADGTPLENSDIHLGDSGNTLLTGTAHNELLHGGAGNDTLHGGGGIDWLFGGDGDDLLFGDAGNDVLFGNAGNDTLNGGAGDNFLKGGAGADTFVFDTAGAGHDTIADFSLGEDFLRLKQDLDGNGLTRADQVLAQATQNAEGDAVLHLGAHHDLTLEGVTLAQLQAHPQVMTLIA